MHDDISYTSIYVYVCNITFPLHSNSNVIITLPTLSSILWLHFHLHWIIEMKLGFEIHKQI